MHEILVSVNNARKTGDGNKCLPVGAIGCRLSKPLEDKQLLHRAVRLIPGLIGEGSRASV
jgi:hypothetical protein